MPNFTRGEPMNGLIAAIDKKLVQSLIDFVRLNHSNLQIYSALFRGEGVFVFGSNDEPHITAVQLPEAYTSLALGLLGNNPFIVGYSYHKWSDVPGRLHESITLSNRQRLLEENTPCTTITWTAFVSGEVTVRVQTDAYPVTAANMNRDSENPIKTHIGQLTFVFHVGEFGWLVPEYREIVRIEETRGPVGIDRYSIRSKVSHPNDVSISIKRIGNVHAEISDRRTEEITYDPKSGYKIDKIAPRGWNHLIEAPGAGLFLNLIQKLALQWNADQNWIC